MVARYLAESIHTRDGSLKTAQYMKGCAQFATYLIEWFGAETPVSQLTPDRMPERSEEHTSELQSHSDLVCRLLLEKKKKGTNLARGDEGGTLKSRALRLDLKE